jgi:hypothetical protein
MKNSRYFETQITKVLKKVAADLCHPHARTSMGVSNDHHYSVAGKSSNELFNFFF